MANFSKRFLSPVVYDKSMQISKNRLSSSNSVPNAPAPKSKNEAQPAEKEGSVLRDVLSVGGATAAGTAGGIYGLAEGSAKGAKGNYTKHIKQGAKIGKAVLTPVGGAVGAIATGLAVSVAAMGAPIAAVLSTGLGFIGGTAVSALAQGPATVSQTARAGAQLGANAGRVLGAPGAVVGTIVGSAVGAVGGLFVAAGKGLPNGMKVARQGASMGGKLIGGVPKFSQDTWNIAYNGGRAAAGGVGLALGGTAGAITATGATIIDGLTGGVQRGGQWAQNTSEYIQGDKH